MESIKQKVPSVQDYDNDELLSRLVLAMQSGSNSYIEYRNEALRRMAAQS